MNKQAVVFWAHQGLEFFRTQEGDLFISPERYHVVAICPPDKKDAVRPETCAEVHIVENMWDVAILEPIISDICQRYRDVCLIGLQENDVLPLAHLRQRFNIPGLQPDIAERFRNKVLMKSLVTKEDIPIPAYRAVQHEDDLFDLLEAYGAIIVKPVYGTSTVDTHFLTSPAAVRAFIANRSHNLAHYVAEEYIGGARYHCDSLVHNNEILFCGVCQVDDSLQSVLKKRPLTSLVCHDSQSPLVQQMQQINQRVIRCLGLQTGCTHCEFFIPSEDNILFGEISARPGGGIGRLYYEAYGINLVQEWVRTEVGETPKLIPTRHQHVGFTCFISEQGILQKTTDLGQLGHDWITWHRMVFNEVGQKVEIPDIDYGVLAIALFTAPDATLLRQRLDYLLHTFEFEVA